MWFWRGGVLHDGYSLVVVCIVCCFYCSVYCFLFLATVCMCMFFWYCFGWFFCFMFASCDLSRAWVVMVFVVWDFIKCMFVC